MDKPDNEVLKGLALNPDVPAIHVLSEVLAVSLCIDLFQAEHRISLRPSLFLCISHLSSDKERGLFCCYCYHRKECHYELFTAGTLRGAIKEINTQVDLLKNKTLLLDITAQVTEGVVVNGKKIRLRGAEKPRQKSAAKPHSRYTEGPHSESMKDGASQEDQDKDRLSPEELKALKSHRGWPLFKDVFMLSSVDKRR